MRDAGLIHVILRRENMETSTCHIRTLWLFSFREMAMLTGAELRDRRHRRDAGINGDAAARKPKQHAGRSYLIFGDNSKGSGDFMAEDTSQRCARPPVPCVDRNERLAAPGGDHLGAELAQDLRQDIAPHRRILISEA